MTDLMELASRVEAATKPNRGLDRDIADALSLGPDETWERPHSTAEVISMDEGLWIKSNRIRESRRYTASLDAAMTLVPADHTVQLSDWDHEVLREKGPWQAIVLPLGARGAMQQFTFTNRCDHAATAPLALTAAALRARAHQGAAHVDQ